MADPWFEDLNGDVVEPKSLPVSKIYVIDPDRALKVEWIDFVTTPYAWERVVRTNCDRLEVLADHCGCFDSRGDARKSGISGEPFFGLEMYGTVLRHFWVWKTTESQPTMSRKRLWTRHWFDFCDQMGFTEWR